MQKMLNAEKDGGDHDQHAALGDEILPPIAIPAKTQLPPPDDISRMTIVPSLPRSFVMLLLPVFTTQTLPPRIFRTTENVQRQIAVVVVVAMEEARSLLPMQRGVRGIHIQNEGPQRFTMGFQKERDQQFVDRFARVGDLGNDDGTLCAVDRCRGCPRDGQNQRLI